MDRATGVTLQLGRRLRRAPLGGRRVGTRGVLGWRPVAQPAAVALTAAIVPRGVGRRGLGARIAATTGETGAMTGTTTAGRSAEVTRGSSIVIRMLRDPDTPTRVAHRRYLPSSCRLKELG